MAEYALKNGKTIEYDTKEVENIAKILDLSFEDALETWLFDNGYDEEENSDNLKIVNEMTEKAKKNQTTKVSAGDKTKRKVRTAKVSDEKTEIFRIISEMFKDYTNFQTKTTTEVSFSVNNKNFTVKLTEHRPKKK